MKITRTEVRSKSRLLKQKFYIEPDLALQALTRNITHGPEGERALESEYSTADQRLAALVSEYKQERLHELNKGTSNEPS